MPFIRQFILAVLLLPFFAPGQTKSYTLNGTVKAKDGEAYPYRVVFTINGNTLSGYSITRQPTGVDYKAQITGHINKKQHGLTITETKSLDKLPEGQALCLFDASLSYKLIGSKYEVTGIYVSTGTGNNVCGGGTMEFEEVNTPGSVFYLEKRKPLVHKQPGADTITTKEPTESENAITEGVQKKIEFVTDTCVLEIWDGGVIDGDVVTVLYNDKTVLANYTLEKAHKQLRLPVVKKVNMITIIADDEGANPPNTADILVLDGETPYKVTAYNRQGKRANIVLVKK